LNKKVILILLTQIWRRGKNKKDFKRYPSGKLYVIRLFYPDTCDYLRRI